MKKKIYISGPMTGIADFNYPAFNKKAKALKKVGYKVCNPAKIKHKDKNNWTMCLKESIIKMLTCDTVFLLDGWEKSDGATIEKELAEKVNMELVGGIKR